MLSLGSQACFPVGEYFPDMSYGKRLEKALELAGKDRKELAAHLEISVQAVGQVITGGRSGNQRFDAENSARAAQFLGVDHFWLATGEGDARLKGVDWPFTLVDRERYENLSPERRGFVQSGLERLIAEQEEQQALRANGTNR